MALESNLVRTDFFDEGCALKLLAQQIKQNSTFIPPSDGDDCQCALSNRKTTGDGPCLHDRSGQAGLQYQVGFGISSERGDTVLATQALMYLPATNATPAVPARSPARIRNVGCASDMSRPENSDAGFDCATPKPARSNCLGGVGAPPPRVGVTCMKWLTSAALTRHSLRTRLLPCLVPGGLQKGWRPMKALRHHDDWGQEVVALGCVRLNVPSFCLKRCATEASATQPRFRLRTRTHS